MSIIEKMVGNLLATRFEDLDADTVAYAKLRIADTLGALVGGVKSSGSDMMLDIVKTWGGARESTILAAGGKWPAANAAMVMSVMARSNDYEPAGGPMIKGRKSPGHYSATSVPTAIALAEKLGLGGRDIITALVGGDDLASRIGAAGAAPWDIGWEPSGTASRFGAAAIAGKLMGLDEGRMRHALGIALNQIAGTMQAVYDYSHAFKLNQGLAAWNGIISAELAARGFTGPDDPLMAPFGYYHQYAREVDESILTDDLGKKFYADEEFKLYPSCRGNAGPVESALKIVRENAIKPGEIAEVVIELAPTMKGSFLIQPFRIGGSAQATAILNMSYNVANVLLRQSVKLEHYTDAAVRDPAAGALARKVRINTTGPGKGFACRVTVKMGDGREFSAATEMPRGDWRLDPITPEEIREKFLASAAFSGVIGRKPAEKALAIVAKLEEAKNITALVKSLTPAAG
jgi:2-methylcitrate dehydratase PrpD